MRLQGRIPLLPHKLVWVHFYLCGGGGGGELSMRVGVGVRSHVEARLGVRTRRIEGGIVTNDLMSGRRRRV
jgi:hypothetical protein